MANVSLAFRRTTSDALTAVSSTASVITNSADALASLAATASANASAYHRQSIITLRLDEKARTERRIHDLATEDARFYRDLDKELSQDPRLKELYQTRLEAYKAVQLPELPAITQEV